VKKRKWIKKYLDLRHHQRCAVNACALSLPVAAESGKKGEWG
jgi:hypothetical protein